jgi:hypothetical protein
MTEPTDYPYVLIVIDRLRSALWVASKASAGQDPTKAETNLAYEVREFATGALSLLDELTAEPRHVLMGSPNRPKSSKINQPR